MSTMIQFEDKLVPYEVFVKDLARELTAQTCEALRLNNNEPTLKSKACFRCLFITKIISG